MVHSTHTGDYNILFNLLVSIPSKIKLSKLSSQTLAAEQIVKWWKWSKGLLIPPYKVDKAGKIPYSKNFSLWRLLGKQWWIEDSSAASGADNCGRTSSQQMELLLRILLWIGFGISHMYSRQYFPIRDNLFRDLGANGFPSLPKPEFRAFMDKGFKYFIS